MCSDQIRNVTAADLNRFRIDFHLCKSRTCLNVVTCLVTTKFWTKITEGRGKVVYSHMMAIRELKLPMLKHSRATSMKNSMTRARCFFFTGCQDDTDSFSPGLLELNRTIRCSWK